MQSAGGQFELSDELKAELDRRLEAYEKDPTVGVSWDELDERLSRPSEVFVSKSASFLFSFPFTFAMYPFYLPAAAEASLLKFSFSVAILSPSRFNASESN